MIKTDKVAARGIVKKTLINKTTNKIVGEEIDHNLIVKVGRSELIKLIAGTSELVPGEKTKVKKMAVGTGGVNQDDTPIPPTDGDMNLSQPVTNGKIDISTVEVDTNRTNPRVTFTALFDCDIVNAQVSECGLFFNDITSMFARHTFKSIPLLQGSNLAFQITWAIEF